MVGPGITETMSASESGAPDRFSTITRSPPDFSSAIASAALSPGFGSAAAGAASPRTRAESPVPTEIAPAVMNFFVIRVVLPSFHIGAVEQSATS